MLDYLKDDLETVKKELQRIHFFLTEPETEEIRRQTLDYFDTVFKDTLALLSRFLKEEYSVREKEASGIISRGFELKLYNAPTYKRLKELAADMRGKKKDVEAVFARIRDDYVFLLRLLLDMLSRFGDEADEEEG